VKSVLSLLTVLLLCTSSAYSEAAESKYRVVDSIEIDKVPSWFPVGFCLLTHGDQQYVAYYNEKHQMIAAQRGLDERTWQKAELPSKVGWDSHNYITMCVDSRGDIHLAGNMHCVPLIYFRTQTPGDATTFQREAMTGKQENRCTYPRFLKDADGNLLFMYRNGGSGNGRRFYNAYNVEKKTWSKFLDGPLFDGDGKRNAYPIGPKKMKDGLFHVVWVWRDTPDCATNHHLSYARSRDLKNWTTAGGKPVTLPLTLEQTELCIDPVPPKGGIINGCQRLAFDSKGRPMVSYHKLDENGHMQIYVTRFEDGKWQGRAITKWKKNVHFSGGGAMPFIGIRISGLTKHAPGVLAITYRHRDYGRGKVLVDEGTFQPLKSNAVDAGKQPETLHGITTSEYPSGLLEPTIDFEGIRVKLSGDSGRTKEPKVKYVLHWETLDANRDRPRKPPLPPASTLKLLKLQRR